MNKLSPTQPLGWLIGLLLLLSWNLWAEGSPDRIVPHYPVHSTESFHVRTPAIDPDPISLTAIVGTPFRYDLPRLLPRQGTIRIAVTGLPANGLGLFTPTLDPFIAGTPITEGVMSLTLVNTETTSGTTAWRAITLTVNPPPAPISLTATVGEFFRYDLPRLLPRQGTIRIAVTGLPANGLGLFTPTLDPFIEGTPLTAGVMSLTLVDTELTNGVNNATAWRAITITVTPPLPPISLTATVGEFFRYDLPRLLPRQGTIRTAVTGLPANGLNLNLGTFDPNITGAPLTSGVMNLTLVNTELTNGVNNATAFRAITLTINSAPGTPPTNHPPVAPSIPSQTATVGLAYFQNTPSFTDPDGQAIAVQAFGLPPGLSYTGTASGIVAGTPTTAGVYSVSLVGTDLGNGTLPGGLSATAVYTITVSPATPGGGALTLLAPTYTCTTGAFRFNTSGGDGSPITFAAIGITSPTTNPNQFVDADLRTAADAPLITLSATQNGTLVTYVWNIRAVCPVGPGTPPVNPPGGALTLLAPTYNCETGAFRFNTSGGDGSAITFSAIGITGLTTNPNQFVDADLRTAADAPLITLSATQKGTTVTYVWNIRAQCPVGQATPPLDPPVGSALTLLAPTYNCATGAFTFNTSGGNGTTIEYRAVPGITDWTTNPSQFVDEGSRTANDVQPFHLEARQNGVVVSLVWNLKAACGRARQGAGEPERRLTVVVLGNPVVGETVQVEVWGTEGQPLRVALTNVQGHPVSEERIKQAAANERLSLKLGRSMGIYLLQVSSLGQTKVVRVLKTE